MLYFDKCLALGADVADGTNKLHVLSGPAPVEDTDVELGFSFKDISYGLGHLSLTVVSATAAAQYKVGEGEWKSVADPAGMSTVAGGFRTVE